MTDVLRTPISAGKQGISREVDTPSLRARHFAKQLGWHEMLVPELARRLGADPDRPEESRPTALVAAALASAVVCSRLLGISNEAAARWTRTSGAHHAAYAAELTRR
ncbi:hypothetical protein ACIQI8_44065 [Streptomyces sp. NPDC092369]|uniref:hypothetical protein n=1 Tax=Streptomyces sp. NPDC092369 TaxID=3366015 RepID=UPI003804C5BC